MQCTRAYNMPKLVSNLIIFLGLIEYALYTLTERTTFNQVQTHQLFVSSADEHCNAILSTFYDNNDRDTCIDSIPVKSSV